MTRSFTLFILSVAILIAYYYYEYTPSAETVLVENTGKYQRVIGIGDFHGDLPNTMQVLLLAGIVDRGKNWIAGNDIFVQTVNSTSLMIYALSARHIFREI